MIEIIKQWLSVATSVAVILLVVMLVGGNIQPIVVNIDIPSSDSLGAGSRFPNGLSADSTSPSVGQVRGTTLTVTGTSTLTGATIQTGDLTVDTTDLFVDVSADRIGIGTSSPAYGFVVASATSTFSGGGSEEQATTTVYIYSSTSTLSTFGAQIILENPDGATCSSIVLDDAGTALVVAVVTCPAE